ncbi:Phosphatase PHOSPHO-type [Corchorus capsularis]|uniref:Phosphatase PHOSPHO-type n=1 Tax=Corchorus capsularis TaxID=210143 RepID=A0A1R3HAH2_COCAP|nr:Phosphatase PHOSPHO-type [Corchorus capsularis]
MAGIVVLFDFDRTLIDGDSDNWVVTEMGLSDLFRQLRSSLPWNSLMGLVLDDIYASAPEGGRQKCIYLGDGGGDYCPTLKLQDTDHVMPRKNYPLWNRIFSDPALVKAAVHEWSNGEELEKTLLHLINTISTKQNTSGSNSSESNSSNCKLHMSVSTPEVHTRTLKVPH